MQEASKPPRSKKTKRKSSPPRKRKRTPPQEPLPLEEQLRKLGRKTSPDELRERGVSRVRSVKISDLAELVDRTLATRNEMGQMQRRIDKLVEALEEMKQKVRDAEARAEGLPSAFTKSRPRLDSRDVEGERRDLLSEIYEVNRGLQ